jgi:hypothetical protein
MELVSTCCGKLTLDWHGPFSLCLEELQSVPVTLAGVYLLSAFVPSRPVLTPFYVGQSRDVRRRLSEHLLGQRTFARHLRTRLSTYFSVAAVSDAALRSAAEAALIRHLQPAGNETVPRAAHVAVSLPLLAVFGPFHGSA